MLGKRSTLGKWHVTGMAEGPRGARQLSARERRLVTPHPRPTGLKQGDWREPLEIRPADVEPLGRFRGSGFEAAEPRATPLESPILLSVVSPLPLSLGATTVSTARPSRKLDRDCRAYS